LKEENRMDRTQQGAEETGEQEDEDAKEERSVGARCERSNGGQIMKGKTGVLGEKHYTASVVDE
jgi:hypothetical protein